MALCTPRYRIFFSKCHILFVTFVWFLIRNVLNIYPIPVCHISNKRKTFLIKFIIYYLWVESCDRNNLLHVVLVTYFAHWIMDASWDDQIDLSGGGWGIENISTSEKIEATQISFIFNWTRFHSPVSGLYQINTKPKSQPHARFLAPLAFQYFKVRIRFF